MRRTPAPFPVPPALRSWAEIDLAALRHNLAAVRSSIGPEPSILAVVKANAYGHGTVEVARALAPDVGIFGVANLPEARAVIAAGTGRDVMLLSPCLPAERPLTAGLIVTVSSPAEAAAFAAYGPVRLNFKIDTGMGRVGAWQGSALDEVRAIADLPGVTLHSISTHLPSSDEDAGFTLGQLEAFAALAAQIRAIVPGIRIHSLNSAGILAFPEHATDIVRAGLVLYGVSPLPAFQSRFLPALSWKARVTLVRSLPPGTGISYGRTFLTSRPTRTAVLAAGYADGFPRHLSGRGACVLIGGRRHPVVGRVTMDQVVVDITDGDESIAAGDEAVLIGRQGDEEITASDLAASADTIPWEILTGIQDRVARIYAG